MIASGKILLRESAFFAVRISRSSTTEDTEVAEEINNSS